MLDEHAKNVMGKPTFFGTLKDDFDNWSQLSMEIGKDGWPIFTSLPGGWVPRRDNGYIKLGQLGLGHLKDTHFTNIVALYDGNDELRLIAYKATRNNASMYGYHAVIQGMIEMKPSFNNPPLNPNREGVHNAILHPQQG
jgi:hypothetical protein